VILAGYPQAAATAGRAVTGLHCALVTDGRTGAAAVIMPVCEKANHPAVADASVDHDAPADLFEDLMAQVASCFARRETRQTCRDMVNGLLTELEDHNFWTMAEAAGHDRPYRMQWLSRLIPRPAGSGGPSGLWVPVLIRGVGLAVHESVTKLAVHVSSPARSTQYPPCPRLPLQAGAGAHVVVPPYSGAWPTRRWLP
jgi:hypothetical protein